MLLAYPNLTRQIHPNTVQIQCKCVILFRQVPSRAVSKPKLCNGRETHHHSQTSQSRTSTDASHIQPQVLPSHLTEHDFKIFHGTVARDTLCHLKLYLGLLLLYLDVLGFIVVPQVGSFMIVVDPGNIW